MVFKDLVSQYALAASRKPRVQTSDRLLHVQAGVQTQILGKNLRSMYGFFLRIAAGRSHEQAISVYTWGAEPRVAYPR